MANELLIATQLLWTPRTPGELPFRRDYQQSIAQAGSRKIEYRMPILTTATALVVGAITNLGWCWFKNRDATNYVKLRNGASGADLIRIGPDLEWEGPLETTATLYAIANVATVELEYCLMEA